ncbi:Palmitoyltransferase [Caligus rogercresseyi]|uniref:Palmitoyltransferase n=1 Tax=Caligus rogercresseyi TaxID=217165 RepID=A0A7T8GZJ8_CALRO|nr:Palmitoyltransferase [Caligus rogercresseyi]
MRISPLRDRMDRGKSLLAAISSKTARESPLSRRSKSPWERRKARGREPPEVRTVRQ